jgi:hypothetical protein
MMARWHWLLLVFSRKLWLRVTLFGLAGVASAVAGIFLAPYVPDTWTFTIGAKAIDGILNVLASSMLAVTVFSVSTMVAAYGAATNNVTPRATRLLMEDNTSKNVLGTFRFIPVQPRRHHRVEHRVLWRSRARGAVGGDGRPDRADCRHNPALGRLSRAVRPARRDD